MSWFKKNYKKYFLKMFPKYMDKNILSKRYLDHKKYLTSWQIAKSSTIVVLVHRWTILLLGRKPRKANLKIKRLICEVTPNSKDRRRAHSF